ncbi:MAG TPA: transglycosylase SLT domain-containing protein [Pyrinomonadaceae bacterium]|jgi:soluble lytic murein transglycosylase-like protein/TolA-binding protein
MSPLTHVLLVCASTFALSLACVRTHESPRAAQTNSAAPEPIAFAEFFTADAQGDEALANVRSLDRAARTAEGAFTQLPPEEHIRRAAVYHANRAFDEARAHWQAVIERYPSDPNVPAAMFGIGRSLFQERRYSDALPVFQKLGDTYPQTLGGRDGFYYVAATLLRMERAQEAAARYIEYTARFPQGERIENAYLNVIDSLREAGRPEEALPWVARTRERFAATPTATNALFARLRLDVSRGDWETAVRTADELLRTPLGRGVQTSSSEVAYLKAYSLERAGRKEQAAQVYLSIPEGVNSYYGGLATARLGALGGASKSAASKRAASVQSQTSAARANYPAPFREIILRSIGKRKLDPRLLLSIMRQESGFNPRVKSGAAARGLMQLTVDTASRYSARIGVETLRDEDFYRPEISIGLSTEYLLELLGMFPDLPEAIAASYNGGEDSVARWVKRAGQKDPGVFASEVGFTETKDYVFKVMSNYRAYKQLYTEDLRPRR